MQRVEGRPSAGVAVKGRRGRGERWGSWRGGHGGERQGRGRGQRAVAVRAVAVCERPVGGRRGGRGDGWALRRGGQQGEAAVNGQCGYGTVACAVGGAIGLQRQWGYHPGGR